jgi:glucosylceramidase
MWWVGRDGANPAGAAVIVMIDAWVTRNAQSLFQRSDSKPFHPSRPQNDYPTVEVDSDHTYQRMDGFGFALTGGSASLIAGLSSSTRAALLQELFGDGDESIGLSCLRLSIGASDLGPRSFSYCDLAPGETDPDLIRFDLAAGDPEIVPLLQQILVINPGLKIVAAPWSAPAWMKSNGSFIAGQLKPEFFGAYARYFVKYIEAMRGHGIHITMVTPQNEPLNPKNEPSLVMSAAEQAVFIRDHLGPALRDGAPDTEIFGWDHNCDKPEYPLAVLADAGARAYISGVAWHLYAGSADVMSDVHAKYPDQKTYFTEQWVFSGDDFHGALRWHAKNVVISTIRNWSGLVLEWNLASDPECKLHTPGGAEGALGGITIGETISRNPGYYLMAHTARFIRPGSVRIQSTEPDQLPNVTCMTPDARVVMVMVNDNAETMQFNVKYQGMYATLELEAGSVATFQWPGSRTST